LKRRVFQNTKSYKLANMLEPAGFSRAKFQVAAGIDQRMSGELMPVVTVAGSGDQGIASTVPVALRGQ